MIAAFLPDVRPTHQGGLATWVAGTLAAGSRCEQAVLNALEPLGLPEHATRARLREVLCDGADRAAPCAVELDVEACFAPLLGWVVAWWTGAELPLAIDATSLHGRQVVLAISVLSRGSAIPVAWVVLPHWGKGRWLPHLERLLARLGPVVPPTMTVLVLTDQGLWIPRLWRSITDNGWHPLMRIRPDATFAPVGERRQRAQELVPGPGCCWVGDGVAYKQAAKRIAATLVVVWDEEQEEPWLLLTDLARTRWTAPGTGCGPGSRWASAPSSRWAGSGSAPGAAIRPGWRGTGWCWPLPRCSAWPSARDWRRPPSTASRQAGCAGHGRGRLRPRPAPAPAASSRGRGIG